MADPKAVLAEYGTPVPDNLDVKVVGNADDCVHITLPAPPAGHTDLSDDELIDAAGGDCFDVMCSNSVVSGAASASSF